MNKRLDAIPAWVMVLGFLLCVDRPVLGAPPALTGPAQTPAAAVEARLKSVDYAKALEQAQASLMANPNDTAMDILEIKAMMGLGQNMNAARLALGLAASYPRHPEFRLLAGLCAFRMGYLEQALAQWGQLKTVPGWQGKGYELSIQALIADGQLARAKALALDAVSRVKPPSEALVADLLLVDPVPQDCLSPLKALLATNPPHAEHFYAQEKLLEAAGPSGWYVCTSLPKGPVTIPLQEKDEQLDLPDINGHGGLMATRGEAANVPLNWHRMTSFRNVVVPLTIAGGPKQWMVLRSSPDFMVISESAAKSLKLTPLAQGHYSGMAGQATKAAEWVLCPEIAIGGITIHNVPAMVIADPSDFWQKRGVLPLSIFRSWAVFYDRRHSHLTLYPSGTAPASVMGAGSFRVASAWPQGRPYVGTSIHGHPGCFCAIDTGAYTTFIASEHAPALGVLPLTGKYGRVTSVGITGNFASTVAERVDIQLGEKSLQMETLQVIPLEMDSELFPVQGVLGRDVLDLFAVFFDWQKNVVAFKAYDKP